MMLRSFLTAGHGAFCLECFEKSGRKSRTFNFEGAKLQSAIFEILRRCGTPYNRGILSVRLHLPKMRMSRSVRNPFLKP